VDAASTGASHEPRGRMALKGLSGAWLAEATKKAELWRSANDECVAHRQDASNEPMVSGVLQPRNAPNTSKHSVEKHHLPRSDQCLDHRRGTEKMPHFLGFGSYDLVSSILMFLQFGLSGPISLYWYDRNAVAARIAQFMSLRCPSLWCFETAPYEEEECIYLISRSLGPEFGGSWGSSSTGSSQYLIECCWPSGLF